MVLYWDASAILSLLFEDEHSLEAQQTVRNRGVHFVSSLAAAETYAVMNRMKHEVAITNIIYKSALDIFEKCPLRKLNIQPDWKILQNLSSQHILKGADLWHLAAVKTIQDELPEVKVITFDKKLFAAAKKEKVAV